MQVAEPLSGCACPRFPLLAQNLSEQVEDNQEGQESAPITHALEGQPHAGGCTLLPHPHPVCW